MGQVDVFTDEQLRTNAGQVADQSTNLQDFNVQLLGGTGDHTRLSTTGFPPGQAADLALAQHIGRAAQAFAAMTWNLWALSSALHIVADVYETADHEDALNFAFMDPDAATPAGLPWYLNPADPLVKLGGKGDREAGNGAGTDGGGERMYRLDDPRLGRQPGDPRHFVTERYDTDGNVVSRRHEVSYPDGRTHYYTEVPRDGGTFEKTDRFHVGPQPAPVPLEEWMRRQQDKLDEAVDESLQELERVGVKTG